MYTGPDKNNIYVIIYSPSSILVLCPVDTFSFSGGLTMGFPFAMKGKQRLRVHNKHDIGCIDYKPR